jgi:gluconokinase
MVSGSGLWNQNENDYDAEILAALPINREQLSPPDEMDQPLTELREEFAGKWPGFAGVPWFPALGDGACNNIGSGCHTGDRFTLMVGTSGAMRAVAEVPRLEIPEGLWCYRVDRRRFVLGGALSNGGEVYAWMKRTLALPAEPEEIESQLAAIAPCSTGLVVLPLFAGERSTKWRADARGAITGMGMHTSPMDILRAALEAVALRFCNIYEIASQQLGVPAEVIASGGALLHSPAWTAMMADALGRPVVACIEKEATSRGAALLALERIGAITSLDQAPPRLGRVFEPAADHTALYREALRRQRLLYSRLLEEGETF